MIIGTHCLLKGSRLSHKTDDMTSYELIDFGGGRKLERVGGQLIDRPSPSSTNTNRVSKLWSQAVMRYDDVRSRWLTKPGTSLPGTDGTPWVCTHEDLRLLLKATPAGQLGVFPEHWRHWDWMRETLGDRTNHPDSPVQVLSLFAYTGATTIALAKMGCHVTHVDASRPTVNWAKENAVLSEVKELPVRWIVDDAVKFVEKEIRRKKFYDAILLDPPTYGHGPQGDRWEIQRDLGELMIHCWRLLSNRPLFVMLCGHSANVSIAKINQEIVRVHGKQRLGGVDVSQAFLQSVDGRKLDCGYVAKYLPNSAG